jgi:DNA-binding transcriptional MerR regulator
VSKIASGLTISAVAARTGMSAAALRAWEDRYGFPRPQRLAGGHRRYEEAEVARIAKVMAERDAGRSLEAAIALVLRDHPRDEVAASASIFAGLRRARPDLPVQVLHRRTMLALSRAVEDETLASGDRPHLVACFQTDAARKAAGRRWRDLTATAASTLVFADLPRSRVRGSVVEVAIEAGTPMGREWAVVSDGPGCAAVLAGWERADGRFEALWTVEEPAVRQATEVGRRLAAEHAPSLELPDHPPPLAERPDVAATVRRATSITNRVIAHLDR